MQCWYHLRPLKEETMSADEADKTLKQDLEDTREDLKRTADEIRVKLHLAGMDAKDAWDDLQPRIEDFERRFDAKAEEVSEELKALGSDIKQRLLNIKAKLKSE
jgi:DNA anti-recombination protein RmuC